MLPDEITSLQHPLVKHFVKLRTERRYREEKKSALLVGTKLVQEVGSIKTLLVEKGVAVPSSVSSQAIYFVSAAILKKITGVENPEPFAAECALPAFKDLSGLTSILVLDGISDPGNLGTLIRTALALGWQGVFILENSCDPFNEKALRAAKGATFRLPLCVGTWSDFEKIPCPVFVADASGKSIEEIPFHSPLALILGNESQGVSPEGKKRGQLISIPMSGKMESLNVAIAGSILMYQMGKCHEA